MPLACSQWPRQNRPAKLLTLQYARELRLQNEIRALLNWLMTTLLIVVNAEIQLIEKLRFKFFDLAGLPV